MTTSISSNNEDGCRQRKLTWPQRGQQSAETAMILIRINTLTHTHTNTTVTDTHSEHEPRHRKAAPCLLNRTAYIRISLTVGELQGSEGMLEGTSLGRTDQQHCVTHHRVSQRSLVSETSHRKLKLHQHPNYKAYIPIKKGSHTRLNN